MRLAVLSVHDGRGYLEETLPRAKEQLPEPEWHITIDDSDHELGFAGAIQAGWEQIAETEATHVFHLEEDFVLERPVPVEQMAAVLDAHPYLAQIVLQRQPINASEQPSLLLAHAESPIQRTWRGNVWCEHRCNWSTNPSLYPAAWCWQGWPDAPDSEGKFSRRLLADADLRFAYWGALTDPPAATHIGERQGTGY